MKQLAIIVHVLALMAIPAVAQNDFDDVQIKAQRVSGNIYMLAGAGGNLGASTGEDGIILIDDQFAPLAPKIKAALAEISDSDVLYVINTHWHGDHTGGNEFFGERAPIVAHHNVRKRLAEGMDNGQRKVEPASEDALPDLTFGHDLTLHYNGEDIRAIHLPHGHTDGDIVIWFPESNVIHMGDHYFQGRFPFIDLASGGSVHGLIHNIEKVIGMLPEDVRIIPGHGNLSNLSEMKEYLAMLEGSSAIVKSALAEGKTLEEMKEEKILADWDDWGWQFISTETFLETLVTDLSRTEEHDHHHERHDMNEHHREMKEHMEMKKEEHTRMHQKKE